MKASETYKVITDRSGTELLIRPTDSGDIDIQAQDGGAAAGVVFTLEQIRELADHLLFLLGAAGK